MSPATQLLTIPPWKRPEAILSQRDPDPEPAGPADPGACPESLLTVPGFVDNVVDHTLATAPYPERALAFAGAIGLQSFLAARKVRDAQDTRTPLYVVALANSGAGKDAPRKTNQAILFEADLADCLGDTFASPEALEDRLYVQNAVLFQSDEFDDLIRKAALGKEGRFEGIISTKLKMYTSAASLYPMRARAGQPATFIDQPGLCLFATATPRLFYKALSPKMLANGFVPRLLIVEAGRRGEGQEPDASPLSSEIIDVAKWWAQFKPGETRGNLSTFHPTPAVVPSTAEAIGILRDHRKRAEAAYTEAEARGCEGSMAIWARANEKARRLALIHACSVNHLAPEIDGQAARWACDFADHQTARMLFMLSEHLAESEHEARVNELVAILRRWRDQHGSEWMPAWQLNRRLKKWSERELTDALRSAIDQQVIERDEQRTGGTPKRLFRLARCAPANPLRTQTA